MSVSDFRLLDFWEEVFHRDGCNIEIIGPNSINKIVGFEILCCSLRFLPRYRVFKPFYFVNNHLGILIFQQPFGVDEDLDQRF